ncbi:hypothetical protein [Singulisphaera sp. PoT]|uniref:hypothetical protein n=1 Tax=Singulisphaera sp. PoT TaxID=3411797 RepID=UPI003BF5EB72
MDHPLSVPTSIPAECDADFKDCTVHRESLPPYRASPRSSDVVHFAAQGAPAMQDRINDYKNLIKPRSVTVAIKINAIFDEIKRNIVG